MAKPVNRRLLGDFEYTLVNLMNEKRARMCVDQNGLVLCPRCTSRELEVLITFTQMGMFADCISEYCVCLNCKRHWRIYSEVEHSNDTPIPEEHY